MELQLILSFIGASILLTFMPGPDNIFVLTESLTKGHKNGVAISAGLSCGVLIHTIAVATGLSIIIQQSAMVFTIIKYLGAGYLFYLAYQSHKEKNVIISLKTDKSSESDKTSKLIRKGFFMNVLNPKVSLFFMAFLPQFVSSNGFRPSIQMMILGIVFMIQSLLIFSLIAVFSGKLTKHISKPKFWEITRWSKISVLLVLGLTLILAKK